MGDKTEGKARMRREPTPEDLALAPPVELGTILFSLVEPEQGHAAAFARWYERDHFFAGCMTGADFFSGRRYVAPQDLKRQRAGEWVENGAAIHRGSFLNLYWILKGRRETALSWSVDQVRRLARQGRMGPPTHNISTGFYDYTGGYFSDEDPIPAELALEYPYPSATAFLIDRAAQADESDFHALVKHQLMPLLAPARSMALLFKPLQLPANAPRIAMPVPQHDLEYGWLMLVFSDVSAPIETILALGEALRDSRMGKLRLAAPFRPILPGIDDYSDRL